VAPRSPSAASGGRGKWIAAALAVGVHLAFLLVLVFTVNWQNDRPEAVTAELYAPASVSAPPKAEPAPPEPKAPVEPPKPAPPVMPPPEPPRKVEPPAPPPPTPPPPKVVPKPEPKVEPKPVLPSKADLALKEKQEQERKKKEQAERERKDQEAKAIAQRDAQKKQKDEQRVAETRERQAREAEALKAQAERERVALQRAAADTAAKAKLDADYKRRIQAKIRGNVNLPPDIPGNPEAIFEVVQLPTGEILDAQLRKSSGVRAYDEALHRAILRSSPLPQPESPDLFQRNLVLRFRPLD